MICLLHNWQHHCSGLPKAGEPSTWKVCTRCGKTVVEDITPKENKTSESSKVIQKTLGKHRDALQRLADR